MRDLSVFSDLQIEQQLIDAERLVGLLRTEHETRKNKSNVTFSELAPGGQVVSLTFADVDKAVRALYARTDLNLRRVEIRLWGNGMWGQAQPFIGNCHSQLTFKLLYAGHQQLGKLSLTTDKEVIDIFFKGNLFGAVTEFCRDEKKLRDRIQ